MLSHSAESSFDGEAAFPPSLDMPVHQRYSPSSFTFSPSPSPSSSSAKLASYVGLAVSSALSVYLTPLAALQSPRIALSLPVLQFGALSIAAAAAAWLRPRSSFGRIGIGKAERGERRRVLAAGLLSALSAFISIWQAWRSDVQVSVAVEIFLLPTIYLLTSLPEFGTASLRVGPEAAATCFLVALGLSATSTSFEGIVLALLRVTLESVRYLLLKQGLSGEKKGGFLVASSAVAFISSVATLALGLLFTSPSTVNSIETLTVAVFTAASIATQALILLSLYQFQSPISVASHLFPRNILLLGASTLGRDGIAFVAEWQKMALVLAGGTLATLWNDEELSSAVKERTRRTRRRLGLAGTTTNQNSDAEEEDEVRSPVSSPMIPPARRRSSQGSAKSDPSLSLSLLAFLPLALLLAQSAPSSSRSLSTACAYFPSAMCGDRPSRAKTVDLVFAYYDEALEGEGGFRAHLDSIRARQFVKERDSRVMVYNKGDRAEKELREALALSGRDEVIALPNLGREGATYLQHILLHYNDTALTSIGLAPRPHSPPRSRVLADHTFYQQPHPAWTHVASPRMDQIGPDTGFASLGPVLRTECGNDGRGTGYYEFVKVIYEIFQGRACPPGGQLSAWSAQHVVSRRRTMANSYEHYSSINELMEAPEGHWIHNTWGANNANGPTNPAVGHAVERSWPIIFGCTDPAIADNCPDDVSDRLKCQCLD